MLPLSDYMHFESRERGMEAERKGDRKRENIVMARNASMLLVELQTLGKVS